MGIRWYNYACERLVLLYDILGGKYIWHMVDKISMGQGKCTK